MTLRNKATMNYDYLLVRILKLLNAMGSSLGLLDCGAARGRNNNIIIL